MPTWDANLYLKFAKERSQPSLDLIARIGLSTPNRIIDLGCGPGNSTAMLRQRWHDAEIIGLDSSPEMITAASKAYPNEKWILADVASWSANIPFDIVFSNAALQWLPSHKSLFPHLLSQVATGGVLAVQIPAHYQSPLHQVTLDASKNRLWSHLMDLPRNALTKEEPSFYYEALQPFASQIEIWGTEYYHILDSPQAILEWFKGTGLRPFLEALQSEEQKHDFEQMILDGLTRAYPQQSNGQVLFPFRRLFIIAHKG